MTSGFVAKLYNMEVSLESKFDFELLLGIKISNDIKNFSFFRDEVFASQIGVLEYLAFREGINLYLLEDQPYFDADSSESRDKALNEFLIFAQAFSSSLWLIKDNSVNTELSFLYTKGISVTANYFPVHFTTASGRYEDTSFSLEEINEAAQYCMNLFIKRKDEPDFEFDPNIHISYQNRIDRFFYYLQAARNEGYIPAKIAHYFTMLETLLSTEKEAVTHIICERASKLMGGTVEERVENFKFLKQAYSIRSASVHGSKVAKKSLKKEILLKTSVDLDDILRCLIKKIISSDELKKLYLEDNDDKLRMYFTKLILS